ncbi:unnamed protein product [Ambrosiozyma monospora]|uniref:Unnamed protein product n=1 Tax=Ambrosiozyma monospora TaxID=43982 RepID=A0ACB5U8F0_AMBMO|nr:unnamed protein product [Ambrosiozyma monospora]
MQSDEDIGKVAQATPMAVGRALEMFLCSLVEKSVATANEEGSKKISVQVLNKTIQSDDQFDFVMEVCEKYMGNSNNNNSANSKQ